MGTGLVENVAMPKVVTDPAKGSDLYRLILGATPRPELLNLLEFESAESPARRRSLTERWRGAAAAFHDIVSAPVDLPEEAAVRPVSKAAARYAATVCRSGPFRRTFPAGRVSFCEVEIDRLVVSQRTINLTYAGTWRAPRGRLALAEVCLNPNAPTAPIDFAFNRKGITFTSLDPSLAVLRTGDGVKRLRVGDRAPAPGRPAYAVTTYVGFSASTVNVLRIGRRLILANGYHRLFALRSAGVAAVPVALVEVDYPELELSERLVNYPAAYLVTAPRPPIFKDFFNGRLTADLRLRRKAATVAVEASHEPRAIPAP